MHPDLLFHCFFPSVSSLLSPPFPEDVSPLYLKDKGDYFHLEGQRSMDVYYPMTSSVIVVILNRTQWIKKNLTPDLLMMLLVIHHNEGVIQLMLRAQTLYKESSQRWKEMDSASAAMKAKLREERCCFY